jgi:hypothetical protein
MAANGASEQGRAILKFVANDFDAAADGLEKKNCWRPVFTGVTPAWRLRPITP